MNREIVVISNSPLNDMHEFVSTLSFYVKEHKPNVIFLNDGTILKFHSRHNLEGIHNYYYFKEVFESFLKKYLRYLQQENAELKEVNNYSKRELYKMNKDRLEANLKLVEENERLKEQCKEWKENHKAVCIQRNNILDNIVKNTEERIDYKSRCEKAREYNNQVIKDTKDFYRPTSDVIYSGDTLIDIAMQNISILNGGDKHE